MSDNRIEIQFLNTQLQTNRYILGLLNADISMLSQIIQQKRQAIKEVTEHNNDLERRLRVIGGEYPIIKYEY